MRCVEDRSFTCCNRMAVAAMLANTESNSNTDNTGADASCICARARVRSASNSSASHQANPRYTVAPTVHASRPCDCAASGKGSKATTPPAAAP